MLALCQGCSWQGDQGWVLVAVGEIKVPGTPMLHSHLPLSLPWDPLASPT